MPPDPPGGAWTYLVPLVVLGLILLRGLRTRTLRVERMWIMPALVLLAFGMMLSRLPPPRPGMIAIGLAALALGVAAGWWRGRTTTITVDPQTHALTSKVSPLGVLLLAGLFAVRYGLRDFAGAHAGAMHVQPTEISEAFLLFAVGLVCAQRLEMWLRARRMLAAARRG
ncbi:DUF1453 domain-containing protein [Phenylobacterium sp.]|jgi:membrane protein CcdC involved in cytochrome C biogenesis|uniref:DUF1453 domain-containing protein n=1 Tax=Phenylobacterium sp. TaxID=1871053 RepID=UPI0035B3D74A